MRDIQTCLATEEDRILAKTITDKMEAIAIIKSCRLSELVVESVIEKIKAGKAVIAITENNILLGFFNNVVRENGEIAHAYKVYRIYRHDK